MLNRWALSGNWTIAPGHSVMNDAGGRILFRFHARDVNLVLRGDAVQFRVLVDGEPPRDGHGSDRDEQGQGVVREPRLYQLVRQRDPIVDRTSRSSSTGPVSRPMCSPSAKA
jgi:hypothetical protein